MLDEINSQIGICQEYLLITTSIINIPGILQLQLHVASNVPHHQVARMIAVYCPASLERDQTRLILGHLFLITKCLLIHLRINGIIHKPQHEYQKLVRDFIHR